MSNDLEKKLAETQKELEELKAEYQEFVYVVSHDLHAPLRQITGFSEIIANKYDDKFNDKSKHHFQLIIGGANKAKQILEALVDYSRLDTQAEPFTAIDCNALVEDIKQQLSILIDTSGAEITYPNLPKIEGAKTQISQVFYHLIHNALHYHPPGNKPQIVIELEEKPHLWQFCIKDNGIGVQDNLIEKVFKVLRRAVSDKKYSGIGMGLAISKKILRRHGGKIWCKTTNTGGASFHFTLRKKFSHE